MTGARRQHHDISSFHDHFVAIGAAKHQPCPTACEAENLVGGRMVMMEVIDAVSPLWRPAVLLKLCFHARR